MLDQVRPGLLPSAEVRQRSDGTEGIYDAETGNSFETAPDQANLVTLFDGKRSLLEISAEYLNRHGFVPFAAPPGRAKAMVTNTTANMAPTERTDRRVIEAPRTRRRGSRAPRCGATGAARARRSRS